MRRYCLSTMRYKNDKTIRNIEEIMKIVITSSSDNLDGDMDPRFGRCPYFMVVDTESMEFEAIPNPAVTASGGAGIQAAQFIVEKNVNAVVSGNYGPNAHGVLGAASVDLYRTQSLMTIREAVDSFNSEKLDKVNQPTSRSHSGMRG